MRKSPLLSAEPSDEAEMADAPFAAPWADSVKVLAELQDRFEQEVNHHQRRIETLTAAFGRPATLYVLLASGLGWILFNVFAPSIGLARIDPPPFFWMQGFIGLAALLMTTMVLITQQRQRKLSARRALLDLHVNLLSEQKVAKLIALIEELRRDLPSVGNRRDPQAEAMAQPVNPHLIIDKLEARVEQAIPAPVATDASSQANSAAAAMVMNSEVEPLVHEVAKQPPSDPAAARH